MTRFNKTIESNTEKIKARHMVDGLEVNFERFHKGKQKAFAGLPARGFKLERKIAERAEQEKVNIFCYETDKNVYWENIQTPKTSNFLDQHSDVLSYQNIEMPPNGIADFNEYVLPMFIWRDYCGAATKFMTAMETMGETLSPISKNDSHKKGGCAFGRTRTQLTQLAKC